MSMPEEPDEPEEEPDEAGFLVVWKLINKQNILENWLHFQRK